MAHAIAPWRVTYTPGNWLVLSGPTSLVVLMPAPARMSALLNQLWNQMAAATSIDALLQLLGTYGMDQMPDFGAFFWDEGGLHGLARGAIRVVDVAAGEVAIEGADVVTWREEALGTERHLRIDMEPVDQDDVLQLPLVVGAASASAVYLNTTEEGRIRFPDEVHTGVLPLIDSLADDAALPGTGLEVAPEPEAEQYLDAEIISEEAVKVVNPSGPGGPSAVLPPRPTAELESPSPAAVPEEQRPDPDVVDEATSEAPQEPPASPATPEQGTDEAAGPGTPASPEPTDTDAAAPDADSIGTGQLEFEVGEIHSPPAGPTSQPTAAIDPEDLPNGDREDPVVVPRSFADESDDDGGTVFSTDIAATHKPTAGDAEAEPQVLATWCGNRHPNPAGSTRCRICQAPVDPANAHLVERPLLAGVNTNFGEFVNVDAGVLVGRAPDASKGPAGVHLMRVHSPSSDISRSHLLITVRDWNVVVTDLDSTNGTTVIPTGDQPFILSGGQSIHVELGTVLDLGDGVSLRIEPPRG